MKEIIKHKFPYLLFFLLLFSSFASVYGQERTVTLNLSKVPLNTALKEIEKQTSMSVVYNTNDVDINRIISIKVSKESLNNVMNQLFKGINTSFSIVDNHIVLSAKNIKVDQQKKTPIAASGTITDAKGEPLIGVSVLVKGTSNGTITDMDGNFKIQTAKGDVLEVSYIGYASQAITLANAQPLKIVMGEDTQTLDEVVVTALGIKRSEKALSYNVQQVKGDDLTAVKDANFMNSLNGKVAGVNIQRSASGVGGGTRVVMRGNKSIAGQNNVLYVVDGVPIGNKADRSGDGTGFGGATSGEGIANFNPDDIESLSVLTGPSAAALYGANAANGVILINTKKGTEGAMRLNVSSSVEFANPFVMPEFQNTYGNLTGDYFSWGDKMEKPSSWEPRDFFNTGATFNNSFNLSMGTEKNQTYISASAVNSTGMVENNKYHRYNVTFRNTAKFLKDKLTLDVSASYVREFYNNMISFGTYFNPIVGAYLYPRGMNFESEKYFERYNNELGYNKQSWQPGGMGMDVQNPYWIAYRNLRPEAKDRYMLYANLKYDITEYLNVAGRARIDNTYSESEDKRYASTISTFAGDNGRYRYSNEFYKQKYADIMVNFDKQFAQIYHATVNAGASFEEYDTKGHGYGGDLLLVPNKFTYGNVNSAVASVYETGGDSRTQNFAAFASAELSWNSALYLTLTGRADKPSQLVNSKEEWIFYPSVGLSAIVTELLPNSLRESIQPVLGYFKIRGSYTEVGSPIPFTGLTPGTITHKLENGTVAPFEYYPLSDLKAERTRSYELGIDSRWFNNTVTLGVTIYQSNTYNQLLKADMPGTSGYKYMYVQAGNVQNRGIELTLGYDQTFGDFNYNTTFTATSNKNKIKKLASDVKNPVSGELMDLSDIKLGRFRLREGGEVGALYADRRVEKNDEGYIPYTPGQTIATENTTPFKIGTVNPKWNLGWRHGFNYKGINASVMFTARIGGNVISKTQATLDRFGVSKASADAREAGYVMLGNIKMKPQDYYGTIYDLDSYYVYSATNIRLQEASIGYTLPNKWFGNVVKNVNISVYGTNLWMIYNKAPYDPELTASTGTFGQGYDYFMLPSSRTYGFSLKFGF
ncbi:SusC/RagA family TonB-linked outer membrane protein [Bacteroides congonensis]|uniref:SusC/RagA family TonB-linked outer membrane protein n=1 Tax=Bacteroides congonensis TaxID=1871006 RepID=UPI000933F3D9|nr:SusC/RagA family TonB-linked outer membrane protein [Bacteroides congonensis]